MLGMCQRRSHSAQGGSLDVKTASSMTPPEAPPVTEASPLSKSFMPCREAGLTRRTAGCGLRAPNSGLNPPGLHLLWHAPERKRSHDSEGCHAERGTATKDQESCLGQRRATHCPQRARVLESSGSVLWRRCTQSVVMTPATEFIDESRLLIAAARTPASTIPP
eukprot:7391973-Prymnesium_polylepis.1